MTKRDDIRYQDEYAIRWASRNLFEAGDLEADVSDLNSEYQKYILFCQKMEEKIRLRAQKKIYFWWIQICYDPERKNKRGGVGGKGMIEKSWIEFDKVQKKN